jgi:hypothetical protein
VQRNKSGSMRVFSNEIVAADVVQGVLAHPMSTKGSLCCRAHVAQGAMQLAHGKQHGLLRPPQTAGDKDLPHLRSSRMERECLTWIVARDMVMKALRRLLANTARRVVLLAARVMPPAISIVRDPSCCGAGWQVIVHASTLCMWELAVCSHTCAPTQVHTHAPTGKTQRTQCQHGDHSRPNTHTHTHTTEDTLQWHTKMHTQGNTPHPLLHLRRSSRYVATQTDLDAQCKVVATRIHAHTHPHTSSIARM